MRVLPELETFCACTSDSRNSPTSYWHNSTLTLWKLH